MIAPNIARKAFTFGLLTAAFSLMPGQKAHGFAEIARGNLTLDLQARIINDSNVGGNALNQSDTLYSFRPTLRYSRDVGRSAIDAWFGLNFSRFSNLSTFNFNDYDTGVTIDAPTAQGSRFSGNFAVRFSQDSGSDQNLLRRVQTKRSRLTFDGAYLIGSRTSLRFGVAYRHEDPRNFNTATYYDFTVGAQYQLRSINSLFLDYRRRRSKSNGGVDNVSNTIFLGISRPIGGKFYGSTSIGYEKTDARGTSVANPNRLILRADIGWTPRQTSQLNLRIGRDLDISGFDQSYYNTYVELNGSQNLSQRFTLTGFARHRWYDYQGTTDRSDRVLEFGVGIDYSFNSRLTAGIDYQYRKSRSTFGLGKYNRNRVSLILGYEF